MKIIDNRIDVNLLVGLSLDTKQCKDYLTTNNFQNVGEKDSMTYYLNNRYFIGAKLINGNMYIDYIQEVFEFDKIK